MAQRARWMPHRLYDLVEARHSRGEPVDLYYEKALPVIAAAVTHGMDRVAAAAAALADAALAAAVVPDAVMVPWPRPAVAFEEVIW